MSSRDEWIISQAAPSLQDLSNMSVKCHLDDAITICRYLNREMNAESAARLITTMARREATGDPDARPVVVVRIMRLIAECLIHFDQEREMILDLLIAIQDLPSDGRYHWWKLPSFEAQWTRCFFEKLENVDATDVAFFKTTGYLEATMYLRGIFSITEDWGCRALNTVCMEQKEFEGLVHESYQWLKIAGPKLIENLQSAQVKSFNRAVRGRSDKIYMMEVTMYEHWEHWKKRFLQVSHDEDFLSPEARQVAKECHEIMKGLVMKQPAIPSEK
ncbi:hypothetical protein FPOAC2_04320 [Fusarium poae]|jgi:hypothetical protein|uniref:Uncharacterized protein n=1 Tax=Fusarium poae TaxID=36050 RepID=A0A1B8ARZ6_FUSPO|nr:hypothetical protein FPOAC1_004249 [Fusarium poae]KAG8671012.1 hypothetical protein FPOAC1_004249 [Fusarium poae]OBS23283.1 hypothetical protein FPOA_03835 [Fusarium poae]